MRRAALAFFTVPALAVVACSSPTTPNQGAPSQSSSRVGSIHNPIINGMLDTTHAGVAALESKVVGGNLTTCSGTIIKVDAATGNGYFLTAAHCVNDAQFPPALVITGTNFDTSNKKYVVTNYVPHPQYNQQAYDFGMVTFKGATADMPTYPILTKALDTLAVGTQVQFVGYGITATSGAGANNSTRYNVMGTIDSLNSLTFHYPQANGGPCEGDSGGPAFLTIGGQEYVAGTTSYGDQNCQMYGVSSRVSSVEAWIEAYIGGTTGAGGSTGAGGTSSGTGGSSSGSLCAGKGSWMCDPVSSTTLCGGAGSACDLDQNGTFQCFMPPNDAPVGAMCDGMNGPFCVQGATCALGSPCQKYCCADGDCPTGNVCQAMSGMPDVGTCVVGTSTGAGGTSSTGAGGTSATGQGGSTATGQGGSTATGQGGSTFGAGGMTSTGAGGVTSTGAGGTGKAGTTGAGAGTATGGGAQAGANGTGTGAGGDGSAANDPAPASSGGCAVGAEPRGTSYGALFGLAALLVARRRRTSAKS